MENIPVTRAYLESMTTSELIRMADNQGIDIPPDLDRIFIIEELLDITSADEAAEDTSGPGSSFNIPSESEYISGASNGSKETEMEDSDLIESVPLPKQYNITFIEVMIRDPLWAFVFWEIKAQDKEHFEKVQDFEGYYLKVSPWLAPQDEAHNQIGKSDVSYLQEAETEGVFTVPVEAGDTAWYLCLSPEMGGSRMIQSRYKVELCVSIRGGETILAVSSPFRLPHLHELPAGLGRHDPCEAGENPLARLSGCGDFHIIRNNERSFRAKKGASSYSYE